MQLSTKRPSKADTNRAKLLKQVTEDGDGKMKRLNVPFEPDLYRRAKLRAAEDGRSMADITRELWETYLSK